MTSTSSRTHRSAADQDVDDLTLGKMLTEAYRGQVDHSVREDLSVCLSSSSMSDRTGQPVGARPVQPGEHESSTDYLMGKSRQFLRLVMQESVITNSKPLKPKKSADSFKDNYGNRNWNFVKPINEVLLRWKSYGNFRVLPSIRSRDENLLKIRTLFWNYQAEYRNCKMK